MRKGLFNKTAFPLQPELSQVQDRISEAVDTLVTAHDVLSSPVVRMIASGTIPAGAAIVVFAGGPNCMLTLPTAANQGTNTASVLMFINSATVVVTLQSATGEKLKAFTTLTVGAGVLTVLVSDGVAGWFSK